MTEFAAALAARPGLLTGGTLLAALVVVLIWEARRPARIFDLAPDARMGGNYGLLLANQAVGFVIVPFTAFVAALSDGMRPTVVGLWPSALLSLLVVDATHWALHRLQHRQALLWRFHAVHHSDAAFDASLAFRFHPLEVGWVAMAVAAAAALARVQPEGLLLAVVVTTAWNIFEHANARLPNRVERVLRLLLITPDLHRMHHAVGDAEGACNYGTVFSLWDRWAGTLKLPAAGEPARFGLRDDPGQQGLGPWGLLAAPFRRRAPLRR